MNPAPARFLTAGQRVTISGPEGVCDGDVLRSETPADLPEVNGPGELARVRAIMREWDIVEVALILHLHNGRAVAFFALRDQAGNWRDLQGQPLTITPAIGEPAAPDAREEHQP